MFKCKIALKYDLAPASKSASLWPEKHIFEVQLVHRNLMAVRAGMGGHDQYVAYRSAFEMLDVKGVTTIKEQAKGEGTEMETVRARDSSLL